jgi:hypothetical protein
LDISGNFAADRATEFYVHVGPTGTPTDARCYAGRGRGQRVIALSDTLMRVWAPTLARSASPFTLFVRRVDNTESHTLAGVVTMLADQHGTAVFSLRNTLPPNYRAGSRSPALLPAVTP